MLMLLYNHLSCKLKGACFRNGHQFEKLFEANNVSFVQNPPFSYDEVSKSRRHPNSKGHRKIYDSIHPWLLSHLIMSTKSVSPSTRQNVIGTCHTRRDMRSIVHQMHGKWSWTSDGVTTSTQQSWADFRVQSAYDGYLSIGYEKSFKFEGSFTIRCVRFCSCTQLTTSLNTMKRYTYVQRTHPLYVFHNAHDMCIFRVHATQGPLRIAAITYSKPLKNNKSVATNSLYSLK